MTAIRLLIYENSLFLSMEFKKLLTMKKTSDPLFLWLNFLHHDLFNEQKKQLIISNI
jgi:hypothetical protein